MCNHIVHDSGDPPVCTVPRDPPPTEDAMLCADSSGPAAAPAAGVAPAPAAGAAARPPALAPCACVKCGACASTSASVSTLHSGLRCRMLLLLLLPQSQTELQGGPLVSGALAPLVPSSTCRRKHWTAFEHAQVADHDVAAGLLMTHQEGQRGDPSILPMNGARHACSYFNAASP